MFRGASNDTAGAEEAFKAALALDPKHVLANRALASYYIGTGRAAAGGSPSQDHRRVWWRRGEAGAGRLLRRRPPQRRCETGARARSSARPSRYVRPPRELRLAQITYFEKRTADAHTALDGVLARDPRQRDGAHRSSREWLFAEGKTQDALRAMRRPRSPRIRSRRPRTICSERFSLRPANVAGATESFTEVLRLNPRAAAAQLQLSQADARARRYRTPRSSSRRRRSRTRRRIRSHA